ncbi:unnamed protein product [Adineta steineri]|uniref:Uncharacterized protein n=1 Tax=Adineta steineri TaxID=433720 RepID=A0A815S763_9BILA|nr:unnamed protein product [Adineta steineri]CAF4162452.1 unnamed protein product [Adineta steineri]
MITVNLGGMATQEGRDPQYSITIANLKEAKRQYREQIEKEREDIIIILKGSDIDSIPNKIREWLKKQSDEHQNRFEKYQQEYQNKRAQQLANNQAQVVELVSAFNQLAINSKSADEFKKKLKDEEKYVLKKHQELKELKMKMKIPIITLEVDDPAVHKLPVCIRFNADYDQWIKDDENTKFDLTSSIQKQFNLPEKAFEILAVESSTTTVRGQVHPPHGKHFLRQLFDEGIVEIGGYDTVSITLGELNLNIEQEKMNERWNRNYGNNLGETHWSGPLDRGGKPYFCPKGWRRFGIKVADTQEEFDRRWGKWHIAYHGTAHRNASAILLTGLKVTRGCYVDVPVVYMSPSINYSAHYRYAKPWKNPQEPGKYYQMIFQCRVNPQVVTSDMIKPQTLRCPQEVRIDEHFTNNEVEWLICPTPNQQYISDNIICYGIMIRKCDTDPIRLPESEWWHHTPYERHYLEA